MLQDKLDGYKADDPSMGEVGEELKDGPTKDKSQIANCNWKKYLK